MSEVLLRILLYDDKCDLKFTSYCMFVSDGYTGTLNAIFSDVIESHS